MAWEFLQEIGRKIIHLIVLVALIVFYAIDNSLGNQAAFMFLVALLVFFIVLEYFRLDLNIKIPFFHKYIKPKEEHKIYGAIFFISSSIICLAVFSMPVALAALLMTTFGDMTASIVGKKYGTALLFRSKTLIGFLSELLVNLMIAGIISLLLSINIYVPLAMAFIATITETATDEMEDNLIVPIITGFMGQILLAAV